VQRLDDETKSGNGKVIYSDYTRVINNVCVPFFGKHSIANIDTALLAEFDEWSVQKNGAALSKSTMQTRNAALNRVFDEAIVRGFLTQANKPKLKSSGKSAERRPDFDLAEIRAVLHNFDAWILRARNDDSKELRMLLCDYVSALVDTGARPGDELLNLKWNQVKFASKPTVKHTGEFDNTDDEHNEITLVDLNKSCELTVSGKTGKRLMLGMQRTVNALQRIARRNYKDYAGTLLAPLKGIAVANNSDYVFRTQAQAKPTSFQKLFEGYLDEHNLLIDSNGQKRVFYSLRHTYATLALIHDRVPIHTLAKQMGTSVGMIEQHYSHLKAVQAIEQLRGDETRRLIDAGGVLDEIYKPKTRVKR